MDRVVAYIRKRRHLLTDWSAGLLLFLLPLSTALPNLMLIPLVLIVLVGFSPREWLAVRWGPMAFFTAAVGVMMVFAVIKGSFATDAAIYARYVAVLLLFLLFSKVQNTRIPENGYLSGLLVAMALSGVRIVRYKWENPDFIFGIGGMINELLWDDRPYVGFMLALGVFVCLRRAAGGAGRHWLYYLIAAVFLGFGIYISARLSILLMIGAALYFLWFRFGLGKRVRTALSVALLFVIAFSVVFNTGLLSRMYLSDNIEKTADRIKDHEPRFIIWPCVFNAMENGSDIWFGVSGYKNAEQRLVSCYAENITKEDKKNYYTTTAFNTHNQFLDFWLNGGFLPFLLLVAVFVGSWVVRGIPADIRLLYLLFFAFFMVESVLYRQTGYYLFGIFTAMYSIDLKRHTG